VLLVMWTPVSQPDAAIVSRLDDESGVEPRGGAMPGGGRRSMWTPILNHRAMRGPARRAGGFGIGLPLLVPRHTSLWRDQLTAVCGEPDRTSSCHLR
jgi:hypothetical protein